MTDPRLEQRLCDAAAMEPAARQRRPGVLRGGVDGGIGRKDRAARNLGDRRRVRPMPRHPVADAVADTRADTTGARWSAALAVAPPGPGGLGAPDRARMLPPGAASVPVGRPFLHAVTALGPRGLALPIGVLRAELETAMVQRGCARLAEFRNCRWQGDIR